MHISINFLFRPETNLENIREKILSLMNNFFQQCGVNKLNVYDSGINCKIGKNQEFPIFFIDIDEKQYFKLHSIDNFQNLINLLNEAAIEYEEILVNNESEGNFFTVFPFKSDELSQLEINSIGYFHLIPQKVFNEKIYEQLVKTAYFTFKKIGTWLFVYKRVTTKNN